MRGVLLFLAFAAGAFAQTTCVGCAGSGVGGSMVYPSSGVPVSTGSAWGSSLTAPTGTIVGTSDTQTLTNKTLDGIAPSTFAFLDATSSIQTQLNAKQATLSLTTTGTSGAATLIGATLNVPQYTGVNTFAGLSGRIAATQLPIPVALTDGATIATDASAGVHFRVTLGGNRTLSAPTNPTDGEKATWEFVQDATGSRTITLDPVFVFGTDVTGATLTTTAAKRDFLGAIYNSTTSKWYVVSFAKGY